MRKRAIKLCLLFLGLLFLQCKFPEKKRMSPSIKKFEFTNHLIDQSSPYLLQHAHNPVDWYPWGKEALEKAKKENKLLLISIGYAACHWCHVMEHESFEDTVVANFMNTHFVCIKVDREERPDIDQIYMNAVNLITGRGGWPLNVIAMSDGRPVYGGTYFQKKNWVDMLSKIKDFVLENPEKADKQANDITQGVRGSEIIYNKSEDNSYEIGDLNIIFSNWKKNIDYTNGGGLQAPKFPLPVGYQFLLKYYYITKNKEALKAVTLSLDKIANGGIYDQIGGGFARYSTDNVWKVPHFEKMLYDNAQLVSLYSLAYQAVKNPYYKTIVYETLNFVERELTSKESGFFSSLDADSEGEEGKFYVWKKEELQELLGENTNLISDYYSVTGTGNWESKTNILHKKKSDQAIAKKHKISEKELQKKVALAKTILLKKRTERIRPHLDDKIITAWNGLMLKGYIDAYRVFDEPKFLSAAIKNAEFLLKNSKKQDDRLNRNFKNNKSSINGYLDDYAFTIDAFIALYQATFDKKWLLEAQNLTVYVNTHFYDTASGMFFYTSDIDPKLIARKMELTDNVIPASNSQMAINLFVLGQYSYNDDYITRAKKMLDNVKVSTLKGNVYFANWDILMTWLVQEPYVVAIVGKACLEQRKLFDKQFLPNVFLVGASKKEDELEVLKNKMIDGETTIYVCRNKVCKQPETEFVKALAQIKD